MGQIEVLKFLQGERAITEKFFTVKEIKQGLRDSGNNEGLNGVAEDCLRLTLFSLIECKGEGIWNHRKLFRAKQEAKK